MYAGDQPHFCPAKFGKSKKKQSQQMWQSHTQTMIIKNIGDITIDIFRVHNVLSLKRFTTWEGCAYARHYGNKIVLLHSIWEFCKKRSLHPNRYSMRISLQMLWASALLPFTAGREDTSFGEEQLTTGTHTHFKHVVQPLRVTSRSRFTHG